MAGSSLSLHHDVCSSNPELIARSAGRIPPRQHHHFHRCDWNCLWTDNNIATVDEIAFLPPDYNCVYISRSCFWHPTRHLGPAARQKVHCHPVHYGDSYCIRHLVCVVYGISTGAERAHRKTTWERCYDVDHHPVDPPIAHVVCFRSSFNFVSVYLQYFDCCCVGLGSFHGRTHSVQPPAATYQNLLA